MPILAQNDPRISQVQLGLSAAYELPNLDGALASADPRAGDLASAEMKLLSGSIWQVGGQQVMAGVLQNVGYPHGRIFDSLIETVQIDPASLDIFARATEELRGQVEDAIKSEVAKWLKQGIGLTVDLFSAVPVVGWVVDILWDFGLAIADIVKLAKAQDEGVPQREYARAKFDPGTDRRFANSIIQATAKSKNWTQIFMPPGLGRVAGQYGTQPFGVAPLRKDQGGGVRITVADIELRGQQGWTGYAPGSIWTTAQYEVQPGAFRPMITDTGRYFPTVRDIGTMTWGMVTRVAPPMYCVAAERCADAWLSYLGQLRDFVQTTDAIDTAAKDRLVEVIGNSISPGSPWTAYNSGHTAGEWDQYGIEGMRPIRNMRALAKAQLDYLTGPIAAYVDMNYGAFLDNPTLQSKLRSGRQRLMQSSQRCRIDLKNVPDHELKNQLIASGVGDIARCPPPVKLYEEPELGLIFDQYPGAPPVPAYTPRPAPTWRSGALVAALASLAAWKLKR